MSGTIKVMLAGAAALMLTACAGGIDRVANMETTGSEFTMALHEGYVDLANKEAGFYDWIDSAHFRDKAEMAGNGEVVLPEDPNDSFWYIPDEMEHAELNAERPRLLAALDGGGRDMFPDLAARAQVAYDCWVEEAEEGPVRTDRGVAEWQPRELAKCRAEYLSAMEELEAALAPEEVVEVVVMEEVEVGEFIVYFAWDSDVISPLAQGFLDDVAAEAMAQGVNLIALGGHTDTSGSPEYNVGLSERRADAVADYLASKGIPKSAMDIRWFGETDPMVPTGPDVREPNNRRVEITFE